MNAGRIALIYLEYSDYSFSDELKLREATVYFTKTNVSV